MELQDFNGSVDIFFSWPRIGSANDGETYKYYTGKKGKIFIEIYPRQIFLASTEFSPDVIKEVIKEKFNTSSVVLSKPGSFDIDKLINEMKVNEKDVFGTTKLVDIIVSPMESEELVHLDREVSTFMEDGREETYIDQFEYRSYKVEKIKYEVQLNAEVAHDNEEFKTLMENIIELHPMYFSSETNFPNEKINRHLSGVLFIIPTMKNPEEQ